MRRTRPRRAGWKVLGGLRLKDEMDHRAQPTGSGANPLSLFAAVMGGHHLTGGLVVLADAEEALTEEHALAEDFTAKPSFNGLRFTACRSRTAASFPKVTHSHSPH